MINIAIALSSLRPGAKFAVRDNLYSEIIWEEDLNTLPTEQEVNDEIAKLVAQQPFDDCKAKAKQLIAATDWSALPDVGLKNASDFVTYRGILRGLIITPVADPVWPTEPTPIWS
jgi:hypothetical protein